MYVTMEKFLVFLFSSEKGNKNRSLEKQNKSFVAFYLSMETEQLTNDVCCSSTEQKML